MKRKIVAIALLVLLAGTLAFLVYDYRLLRIGEVSALRLLELVLAVLVSLALSGLVLLLYLFADRRPRGRR